MGIYLSNMEMPKGCASCPFYDDECFGAYKCDAVQSWGSDTERASGCPLVPVPSHGRLIDADALAEDLKRQCEEVFKIDAVSPDDFWITRDQAYNERLWKTWCESFYKYLESRPTVIPASGEG